MKIFLDVNVILDLLEERDPFVDDAVWIFNRLEENKDQGYASALSFPILFYLLSRNHRREKAKNILQEIRTVLDVTQINQRIIDRALAAEIADYEDGVQYFSALDSEAEAFISRNLQDFPESDLLMFSPRDYRAFC